MKRRRLKRPLVILSIELDKMTPEERQDFEERAAIREYHGNQSRADAEYGAVLDVKRKRR